MKEKKNINEACRQGISPHWNRLNVWYRGGVWRSVGLFRYERGVDSKRSWQEETFPSLIFSSSIYSSHSHVRLLHCLTLRPSPSCDVQHNRPRKRAIKATPLVETYISKQRPLLGSYTVCTASDKPHMCLPSGLLQFYVTISCTRQDLVGYTLILC